MSTYVSIKVLLFICGFSVGCWARAAMKRDSSARLWGIATAFFTFILIIQVLIHAYL